MKSFLATLLILLGTSLFGQTMTNRQIITEINHELGGENWKIQGDNIIVNNGCYSCGRGLWGVSKVTYEVKYEYWSLQGEGHNTFVLHIKCKDDSECIEDEDNPDVGGYTNELRFPLSDNERRVNNVLELLKKLK